MKFQVINVVKHQFEPIKQEGNVVIAKCTCCTRPRIAVYLQIGSKRIFYFSGYDENIAKMHFNFLIKRQNSQSSS